ncbi:MULTISPECIES: YggS family pyridoxal phosphate-dependent enzyme [unclassified Leeuwenhoekiella]|uniref:YggS family pyridoxal phosphate-dependent enzyme n=1 Tax=unclassified Leeuwenhoekiella TaxID=2615029 RepID=UPI000C42A5E7|nr:MULTISPECIES: YggS family pyridoxal phosphate-dependent enzyme [unclassified Leeuwenhoekiella]MAW94602.1 YggS family pyridoxal phosphate-dependent enzyme [Leeuwenhoekiella sp.]MBA82025.1 YggS family pyridoxal phosphate-dependent enzyme [Leeuwenhoekiella sp.]|tara:strand:- start:2059 stop:2718 length:660 start_codon:yes stop_codon:yes gene_type:complete
MASITENLSAFKKAIPEYVDLVAVSKTKPVSDLQEAYDAGQRIFGENKIQEMTDKWEALPKDINWHMIGHVQTNKVKYMAPYVSLIHSADRLKLFKVINKEAEKNDRIIDVLLQVKIAEEDSKFGMDPEEAKKLLSGEQLQKYPNVRVVGLMGMASFTDDEDQIKREFSQLEKIYNTFKASQGFTTLSMGMSGDYRLALEYGSTMIRIGSAIFGARNYD